MNERPVLVIKLNSVGANDPCAICGERTDPEVGPELFLEGTAALVCWDCGEKYAPDLMPCLLVYWASADHEVILRPANVQED